MATLDIYTKEQIKEMSLSEEGNTKFQVEWAKWLKKRKEEEGVEPVPTIKELRKWLLDEYHVIKKTRGSRKEGLFLNLNGCIDRYITGKAENEDYENELHSESDFQDDVKNAITEHIITEFNDIIDNSLEYCEYCAHSDDVDDEYNDDGYDD
jgi:hypothetical protein